MALPSSGQISMKDILDEKQGGTTARTNISLKGLSVDGVNDSSGGDITGTPDGNAPYEMSEFYDFAAFSFGTPALVPSQALQQTSFRSSGVAITRIKVGFQYRASSNVVRAIFQKSQSQGNGSYSGSGSAESAIDLFPYSGADPASMQVRLEYTDGGTSMLASGSLTEFEDAAGGTGGTAWTNSSTGFRTIATGSSDNHTTNTINLTNGDFTWSQATVTCSATFGVNRYRSFAANSGSTGLQITARALDSSSNVIATSSTRVVDFLAGATKEGGGGFGP
tara:strand:- start:2030 stop:2866 length:837 start_codon:yes stop_codon:yes gene_type:complete